MQDSQWNSGKVISALAWGVVVALTVLGWGFYVAGLVGPDDIAASEMQRLAFMLLLTAGAIAPFAAVLHIRTYAVRLCSLVKATSGLEPRGISSVPRPREPQHH